MIETKAMNTAAQAAANLNALSTRDLEKALAARKAQENAERDALRQQYENEKDALISALGGTATKAADILKAFKEDAMGQVRGFRSKLLEYGQLRKGEANKGNFEIKNDSYKITFSSQVKKCFDERSELAEEKLKSFLGSFVKKRDKDLHDLVLSLLERNPKSGDLDISNIQRLYKLEDRFDNEDWREAIRLFKESYNPEGTAYYVRFFQKAEDNSWQHINLNFSSL